MNGMLEIFFVYDPNDAATQRKLYLEQGGYLVTPMRSGRECLERLPNHKPDLVLLDVLVEGPNGFDVCRSIRSMYKPNELPVILCSTIYRSRIYRDEAVLAGAQRYLLSPVRPEDLLTHVFEAIERRMEPQNRV
jgi:CheY-like chemotaxis protein